jgi:CRISPR/Cas system CMR-associated protein Cmr1 (group 7 of RAMP superfamily)
VNLDNNVKVTDSEEQDRFKKYLESVQSESELESSYTQKFFQQKFQASFGRLPSQQSEDNEIFDYLHPNELQDE